MSQLVLDDQIDLLVVLRPIQRWITAQQLRDLRPGEVILDDRVPEILATIRQPTFITIDAGFWDRRLRSDNYCILYFALRYDQQKSLPQLLRAALHHEAFSTRARRMGKVARVRTGGIDYWELRKPKLQHIEFEP